MNDKEGIILGAAALLSLVGFFASFYTTAGNAAYWWDEAEYSILSRSLTNEGYLGFFGGPSYRPPFLPVYISIFRSLIGEAVWPLLVPFFSALSILSLYLVGLKFFNWKAGVLAAILMLFSSLFIFYSGRMLTEIPGIFFSTMVIFSFYNAFESGRKRDFIIAALFAACAFLVFFRFSMMLVALALFAIAFRFPSLIKSVKESAMAIGAFLVILVPLLLYSNAYFGSPIGIFTTSYLGQQAEPLEWFALYLPHIFSNASAVFLLGLAFLYGTIFGSRQMKYLALLSLLVFISASVLLNHKEDRYLMPMFPAAFLLMGAFALELLEGGLEAAKNLKAGRGAKVESAAARVFASLIILLLLYSATFANLSPAFQLYDSRKASFGDVKEAAVFVRDSSATSEVLMTDSVTAMFHSDRHSLGFNSGNLTAFLEDLQKYRPTYLIMTAYESRDNYVNALNNYKNIKDPANSVEYVLLHPEKFVLMKIYPSEQSPYVLVFKISW